jgi:hypothetical protein
LPKETSAKVETWLLHVAVMLLEPSSIGKNDVPAAFSFKVSTHLVKSAGLNSKHVWGATSLLHLKKSAGARSQKLALKVPGLLIA